MVPCNENFDNKVMKLKKEIFKMYKKQTLLFVDHRDLNPKAHLNKSKLHLNRNRYEKLGKNFVSFIRNTCT